jgi:hypothetical protein
MAIMQVKFLISLAALLLITACNNSSEFSQSAVPFSGQSKVEKSPEQIPAPDEEDDIISEPEIVVDLPSIPPVGPVEQPKMPLPPIVPEPEIVVVPEPQPEPTPIVDMPAPLPPAQPMPPVVSTPPVLDPVDPVPMPKPMPPVVSTPPVLDPVDPVEDPEDNVPPTKPAPEGEEKKCKYSFHATHIGSNVKVTVISGTKEKLSGLQNEELSKLAPEDQTFLSAALQDKLTGVPVSKGKSQKVQSVSEKLAIKGPKDASAKFNQIAEGVTLNYLVKGTKANIHGNTMNRGSRIFAVLDGSEEASVKFTSIKSDSEIFVLFLAKGDNVTCVKATGIDGKIGSYVYGEKNYITEGHIKGTGFDNGGTITHYVTGGDHTLSTFKATSITETQVSLTTLGGNDTHSKVHFTGLDINNTFDIIVKGKDDTSLDFKGTNAGQNTTVNLDIEGFKNTGAQFQFTAERNVNVNGRILANNPYLHQKGNLKNSKSAKIAVSLDKR